MIAEIKRVRRVDRRRRRRRRLDRPDCGGRGALPAPPSSGCPSTSASARRCRPGSGTRSSTGTTWRCGSTATASTTRPSSRSCSSRSRADEADVVTGSRFRGADGEYRAAARPPAGDHMVRAARLAALAPAGDRHDLGLPGAQQARDRALRTRLSERLPRGRGDRPPPQAPAPARRGARADARARARLVVDHDRFAPSTTPSR